MVETTRLYEIVGDDLENLENEYDLARDNLDRIWDKIEELYHHRYLLMQKMRIHYREINA